ncbi:MAG: DUF3570 domain-containing protein [Methylovulum sp.]|nr:DUF3570 domain-containing protein [Methylovulum sp.]
MAVEKLPRVVVQAVEVVVAVIKKKSPHSALHALTFAALALPGIMAAPVCAENNDVDFQYGHYQEGKRNLFSVKNDKNPIEVESLFGKATFSLTDRVNFTAHYSQDTWSGATPISTAPLAAQSNRAYLADTASGQTITAGASPYLNTQLLVTKKFVPLQQNDVGKVVGKEPQIVHIMSMASPETRKQGDFNLGYEWDESAITVGGGLSLENDYESRFGNVITRWDFNQKRTTVNLGLSYTNSDTSAILDHDASPYITKDYFAGQLIQTGALKIMQGNRQDWSSTVSLTQIINKYALFETSAGYTQSTGYLENPYKVMTIMFVDPEQTTQRLTGNLHAFLEQRPEQRNQFTLGGKFIQHIGFADAAMHLEYRFFHDDWGIAAHTFGAEWVQPITSNWVITPKIRYYSQDAADFYQAYVLSKQAYSKTQYDPATGKFNLIPYDSSQLPNNFSSDQRLSAYGAISGGLSISKRFSKAISLEAGVEYYQHAGSLKIGGGGEGNYSDFDSFMANAALKVNLANLDSRAFNVHSEHQHHHQHQAHSHNHAPAGVMFDHLLTDAGSWMIGYRFMHDEQGGAMLHGTHSTTDHTIVTTGCGTGSEGCRLTPTVMDMSMHMLDIMYAPLPGLTLMLMPQFMDMAMNLRNLTGAPPIPVGGHVHSGTGHATGGIGDTGMYALIKALDLTHHHVHFGLGLSAPTGDVDIQLRRAHQQDEGFIHYGMQLGSGTWDFKPSLTYTGQHEQWSWGAQFSSTQRLEDKGSTGYALGDVWQTTAWGSYQLSPGWSASIRGVHTNQQAITGQFTDLQGVVNGVLLDNVNQRSGPMDFAKNYGGRFWDIGFGVNYMVSEGDFSGNSMGVEWLQPLSTDVNGVQLDRQGALSATWGLAF